MPAEYFREFGSRVEAENPKEQEDELYGRIEEIALGYAEMKFDELSGGDRGYKFSQALKDFTPTENIVMSPVFRLNEFSMRENRGKIDRFLSDFYEEVDALRQKAGFGSGAMLELVNSKKASILEHLGLNDNKETRREEEPCVTKAKVLRFNEIMDINTDAGKIYSDLSDQGFSEMDRFIEVHVESFIKTGEKNLGLQLIKNDLAAIAEHIVDKVPETAAVVGKSWLLDTPLAVRLGFKRLGGEDSKQNDMSTWLQFIDADGQINQKRLDELIKTGVLPFKSARGYIPVEEFLQRYLPEGRRGKVILKNIDHERADYWLRMKSSTQDIRDSWEEQLKGRGDLDGFINSHDTLVELLDFIGQEAKDRYLAFWKEMLEKKVPWSEFYRYKSDDLKALDGKIQAAMTKDLYREKDVVIE